MLDGICKARLDEPRALKNCRAQARARNYAQPYLNPKNIYSIENWTLLRQGVPNNPFAEMMKIGLFVRKMTKQIYFKA